MKRRYTVVQSSLLLGERVERNDTVYLTDAEAAPYLGKSIELSGLDTTTVPAMPGEHREQGIDVQEDTRPMVEIKPWDEEVRPNLRLERSIPER
jgi:hypothetical protein